MLSKAFQFVFILATLGAVVPSADDGWELIRLDGIGPVRVGMSLAEVNAATKEKLHWPTKSDIEDRNCFFADSKRHPKVSFMFEKGRLTRVDVQTSLIKTNEGIGVGDSERRAIAVYGHKLKTEPNAYTGPEDHVLTYLSGDGKTAIKFILDHGKVRSIWAGRLSAVSYIEGCE